MCLVVLFVCLLAFLSGCVLVAFFVCLIDLLFCFIFSNGVCVSFLCVFARLLVRLYNCFSCGCFSYLCFAFVRPFGCACVVQALCLFLSLCLCFLFLWFPVFSFILLTACGLDGLYVCSS